MRILVIDDDFFNLVLAEKQLGKEHEIVTAGDYDKGLALIQSEQQFDVVLTDLLMPASGKAQGNRTQDLVGKEMPVGIFLALLAAKRGVKYVGLLSSNHHDHPGSACLDYFGSSQPLNINGSKVVLVNNMEAYFASPDYVTPHSRPGPDDKTRMIRGKTWHSLLACLLAE